MGPNRVNVFRKGEFLYFAPSCGSIAISPVRRLAASASHEEIGGALLGWLADCKPIGSVPWPTDWKEQGRSIESPYGEIPSGDPGSSNVAVDSDGDSLVMIPYRPVPSLQEFQLLPEIGAIRMEGSPPPGGVRPGSRPHAVGLRRGPSAGLGRLAG